MYQILKFEIDEFKLAMEFKQYMGGAYQLVFTKIIINMYVRKDENMNKKLIIITSKVLGFLLLMCFSILNVNAASGYAFSMGTNFGSNNIDTSRDATYVDDLLSGMGYTTYKTTAPTYYIIDGSFSSGRKRLESDLLFLAGHASSSTMYWNYLSKGGSYAQALKNTNVGTCDEQWTYTGIGMYKMSNVDFAFFAGCQTAKGSGNITEYAKNRGAKTTLGWTVDVNDEDAYKWEKNFYTKLKSGATINSAVSYANSFTYNTTTVKNTKLYGSTSATIKGISDTLLQGNKNIDIKNIKDIKINKQLINTEYKKQIADIIKTNINDDFNINDFIIEKAENNDGIIYDFYLKINEVKTDIGYTVFVSNNVVTNVIDNMKGNDINSLKSKLSNILTIKKNLLNKEALQNKALSTININYYSDKLELYDDFTLYETDSGKTYYIVLVKATDSIFNTHSIISHKYLI